MMFFAAISLVLPSFVSAAGYDRFGIEAHLLGLEAVLIEAMQGLVDFRRTQQRLGRNATPVETDAAQRIALHDRGLEAELGGADRGNITAGPGTDYDDIVLPGHHISILAGYST